MSFSQDERYTKDQLVRFARLFELPMAKRAKPDLYRNLHQVRKNQNVSGLIPESADDFKALVARDSRAIFQFKGENLREFARKLQVPMSAKGVRKTKERLARDLILKVKEVDTSKPMKRANSNVFRTANATRKKGYDGVALRKMFSETYRDCA